MKQLEKARKYEELYKELFDRNSKVTTICLNIGYRYQRESGFMFRAGVSPSFNFGDKYELRKTPLLYPYLSFGYTSKVCFFHIFSSPEISGELFLLSEKK